MTIELKVRKLRRRRGWQLVELASKVGVSTTYLSEVERGTMSIDAKLTERLSDALGVAPVELFGAGDVAELIYLWTQLDTRGRERVAAFAAVLLQSQLEVQSQ